MHYYLFKGHLLLHDFICLETIAVWLLNIIYISLLIFCINISDIYLYRTGEHILNIKPF